MNNAFKQGKIDFKNGQVVNPYGSGTSRYRDWDRGFNIAYFDNLGKVKEREQKTGTGS